MKKTSRSSKETVLKSLILLGILGIAYSLYVQYGVPYLRELALEKLDRTRIADLDMLGASLRDITATTSAPSIGKNNTIYISIPSEDALCGNLDLPSVPEGWNYHCTATSTLQNTDGTGWIPVNFGGRIAQLPLDPINNADTLNYYAYVASSTVSKYSWKKLKIAPDYVVTGVIDSKKYLKEKAQGDEGVSSIRYEVKSNKKVWADAEGLVGYWNFDKNTGDVSFNLINNEPASLINGVTEVEGKYNSALNFSSENNQYVDAGDVSSLKTKQIVTISAWIKPEQEGTRILGKYNNDSSGGWYLWFSPAGKFVAGLTDGSKDIQLFSKKVYTQNEWAHVVATFNNEGGAMTLTVNSTDTNIKNFKRGVVESNSNLFIGGFVAGGGGYFDGDIDEVRIYSRTLKNNETR